MWVLARAAVTSRSASSAEQFDGLAPLARHRLVYAALDEMMQGPIHALAITALTPDEAS